MSISRETAARSDEPRNDLIADPAQPQPGSNIDGTTLPSDFARATRSNTPPQQGQSQPGSGSAVHDTKGQANVVELPASGGGHAVPFKERVIGVAKKTRGTVLNKPDLKEHGEKILEGSATIHTPPAHD